MILGVFDVCGLLRRFFFFFFVIQRGCAAVLGTVETSWRVSGRETSTFYLADI